MVSVDTNVLLRTRHDRTEESSIAFRALAALVRQGVPLFTAQQNLAEFWTVLTRPVAANGYELSSAVAEQLLSGVESFLTVLPETSEAYRYWRKLIISFGVRGVQVHDARLVAVMQTYGLYRVLTYNRRDFQRYADIQILDPGDVSEQSVA